MARSAYVKTLAIIFIVYSSLGIIGSTIGLCCVNYIPSWFVEKGTQIQSSVYPTLYTVFGFLAFHYLLLLFLSTCLMALNKDSNTIKTSKK